MSTENCMEQCPIVSLLPEAARVELLAQYAADICSGELLPGPKHQLCGLTGIDVNQLNKFSQAARLRRK